MFCNDPRILTTEGYKRLSLVNISDTLVTFVDGCYKETVVTSKINEVEDCCRLNTSKGVIELSLKDEILTPNGFTSLESLSDNSPIDGQIIYAAISMEDPERFYDFCEIEYEEDCGRQEGIHLGLKEQLCKGLECVPYNQFIVEGVLIK